jgi:hypothetical protein
MDQSEHLSHKLVPIRRRQRPVDIRVTMYGLDDRSAHHRPGKSHPISLHCGGDWGLRWVR